MTIGWPSWPPSTGAPTANPADAMTAASAGASRLTRLYVTVTDRVKRSTTTGTCWPGQQVPVVVERFTRSVTVTYNRVNLDAPALAAVIASAGFAVGAPVEGGQLGRPIVIPAAVG